MNSNEVITVITLTRNRAELLRRAIKSVLNQTHRNIEYIIVDGASEDNTETVVNSLKDERIVYIKQEYNKDIKISIDEAVKISKGDYITFLDDDDEYLPQKIEKQIKLFKSLPDEYGLIYCWMDYIDDNTGRLIKEHHPTLSGYIYYDLIGIDYIGGTPTLMLKKEIFNKVKGWNNEFDYLSDQEFITRVSRICLIGYVPEMLVKVHINHKYNRQSTNQISPKNRSQVMTKINYHKYYLKEFEEGFKLYPEKKYKHYIIMSKYYAKSNQIINSLELLYKIYKELGIKMVIKIKVFKIIVFNVLSLLNLNRIE